MALRRQLLPRLTLLALLLGTWHLCFLLPASHGRHRTFTSFRSQFPRPAVALASGGGSGETSSVNAASMNLAKNLVGSGILSLPAGIAAFSSSSAAITPSLLLLVASAVLSAYTFYLIGKVCQATNTSTFGAAWDRSVQTGKWIPQWVCIFECFGGAVVYSMVLGDVFSSLLSGVSFVPSLLASRSGVILSLSALVLFPLCCLRSFAQLAKFSLLGTLATSYVVVFVVKRFLDGSYAKGGQFFSGLAAGKAVSVGMFNPQMLVLVALLSTAFLVHFNAPQFYTELPPLEPESETERKQKLRDFSKVSLIGFGIASIQYALVMCFGFLTFGTAVSGNVLLNYHTSDPWASAARLAVGVSMLFGYPMQFAGFRDGLLEFFHVKTLPTGKHRLVTGGCLLLAVAVACVFRDLGVVQAVEGALLAAFLVFLAGPIMALQLPMGQRSALTRWKFRSLILVGVAFMGVGCAVNFGWL